MEHHSSLRTVGLVAVLALIGASPAYALSTKYKGASVYVNGRYHDYIKVTDTRADGHDAMAEYFERAIQSNKYRVVTSGGKGSTKSKRANDTIRSARACLEKSWAPDECGAWKSR